jgi:hypothetical protein
MGKANESSVRVLRPCFSTYMFFAGVPAIGLIFSFYAFFFIDPTGWPFGLVMFLLSLAGAGFVARFKIIIDGETLTYRSFLGLPHSLSLSEISQARVDVRFFKTDQISGQPPFALVVEPYPEVNKKPIVINMKMFGREDLQVLFKFFGDKLIDKKHSIKDGLPRLVRFGKRKK